jgi:3-hydroxyisobutyrate dehydrogenase-like beta-hydroxyacid dehydrogenase
MAPSEGIARVGFIGLGKMGTAMARNILRAGFDVAVYNRTRSKMAPLADMGAVRADSPKQAAAGADAVITCLLDDQSMLDNVTGEDGILAGLKAGSIHIGTATISPGCATELAELHRAHGSYYVAGPIFGRPNAAEAGTLLTYVAGDADAVAACERLFDAYAEKHVYMGPDHGVVNSIKLTMNFMLVSMIEVLSEVYTFAEKSGIDLEFTNDLIETVLDHPALREYARRIRTRDFEAAFELRAGLKDVELMLQASGDVQAPIPVAGLARDKFLTALATGLAGQDWSAIAEVTRRNAGLD